MRKMAFLIFDDIKPKSIPFIADRERILDKYARRFIDEMCEHETLRDYCEQASLDIGDKTVVLDLMTKIRRLEREQRRDAA